MSECKAVTVPAEIIEDDLLSDSEFRLLIRLSLKYGTDKVVINDESIAELIMPKSTLYRLLGGLLKREYLQRDPKNGNYCVSVSEMIPVSPKNETVQSQIPKNETEGPEREERTKEEKDNAEENSIYIYNQGVKGNDKEKEKKKEKAGDEGPERFTEQYREIIGYLNEKTGKRFSARSRANQAHMSARLKEGFTVEDFKRVIDIKWFQWHGDAKMVKFLRPETLFSQKFDRYLNEDKVVTRVGPNGIRYTVSEDEQNSDCPF